MRDIHVRFEHENALSSRKQLLSSEINVLELFKRIRNYRKLRRRELIFKKDLKKQFAGLRKEIEIIEEFFPEEKKGMIVDLSEEKAGKKTAEETDEEALKRKNIESQLKEIKEKLDKLNQ